MSGVDYVMAAFSGLTNDERMIFLGEANKLYCRDCGGVRDSCECCKTEDR